MAFVLTDDTWVLRTLTLATLNFLVSPLPVSQPTQSILYDLKIHMQFLAEATCF